jgi:hypothetical protein
MTITEDSDRKKTKGFVTPPDMGMEPMGFKSNGVRAINVSNFPDEGPHHWNDEAREKSPKSTDDDAKISISNKAEE